MSELGDAPFTSPQPVIGVGLFTVKEAIEKAVKEFILYSMSFLAAMTMYDVIKDSTKSYKQSLGQHWGVAMVMLGIFMGIIIFITALDPNDVRTVR